MQLRFIEYFVATARERHFGRAAAACHVAQPTLSAGLAVFEAAIGERLIIRDRRFVELTPRSYVVLGFAQQILADHAAMVATTQVDPAGLRGLARLGVIPAAMPAVGGLVAAVRSAHARVIMSITSMTSRAIEKALVAREIDAGITYLHNEPLAQVRAVPLYAEQFVAVAATGSVLGQNASVCLADLVRHPLCLLHQGMQNRRILDAHLARLSLSVEPVVTADSYVALLAMVADGGLAAIITDSHAALVAAHPGVVMLPISDALAANSVGLVILDREPAPPLAAALFGIARTLAAGTA